ncbi:hypothetical protein LINPERHAP2_LOCUS45948 [Linum perenne]
MDFLSFYRWVLAFTTSSNSWFSARKKRNPGDESCKTWFYSWAAHNICIGL